MVGMTESGARKGKMDDDIEMTDAPVHGACQPPDVGRAGLRPPPGFEHLALATSERHASTPAGLFVNPGEPRFGSENQKIVDSRHRQVPSLLPYESEIPPLRISKSPEAQSSTALDTQSQISESDLVGLPRSRQLPRSSIKSPATMQSNDQGSEGGMSSLPPPVSNRPDDDGDETQVEESEQPIYASRIRVTPTHAPLIDHHRAQIIDIMRRKTEAIKVQEELQNSSIFHLDWSAGNPKDPYTVTLDEPKTGNEDQSSEEDSALKNQTAELVKIFFGAPTPPRDDMWSMPMFFGDWITNNNKKTRLFIEIQIKRVSGADSDLMKRCRIASRDVWLPLADPDYHDSNPNDPASSTTQEDKKRPVSPETLLPTSTIGDTGPGRPGASIPHSKPTSIFGDRIAKAPTGSDLQAITQIISETGLGKRPLDATSTEPDSTNPPVDKAEPSLVNSTGDGEPSSTRHKVPNSPRPPRRKLPNSPAADSTSAGEGSGTQRKLPELPVANTPKWPSSSRRKRLPKSPAAGSTSDGEGSGTRGKLPNLPVANSPSWGSNISNHGSLAASNGESEEDDETDNAATKADKAFAKSFPMVESLLALETTLRLQRKQNMERLMKEPDFRRLKENSFIYCVRVVALPGELSNTNGLTGPGSAHRHATLLASGGWIVPPLEDRMKWRNDNKENRPASDRAIKKAKGCRAPPVTFDWSGSVRSSIHGEPCPVWRELAEPCLEDVYWMVWQLLAGQQYVGFSGGTKFGRGSASIIDTGLLDQCPFKSPSREALHTSALL